MKSQIPGICAALNERITEYEAKLDEVIAARAAYEELVSAEYERFCEKQAVIRRELTRLTSTVSTLQDFADGEL
jgi:hypothetical protein